MHPSFWYLFWDKKVGLVHGRTRKHVTHPPSEKTPPEGARVRASPEPASVRPRMRRTSCMSRGMMVTRLAWTAHRFVSSRNSTCRTSSSEWEKHVVTAFTPVMRTPTQQHVVTVFIPI